MTSNTGPEEWNPLKTISFFSIINEQRIPDYENAFMAAYFIQLDRHADQEHQPDILDHEETFHDSESEHTAVQLADIKERKAKMGRRRSRRSVHPVKLKSSLSDGAKIDQSTSPVNQPEPVKLGILDSADEESLVARSVQPNWFTILSMNKVRKRLLWKKVNLNMDPLENRGSSVPLVRPTNQDSNSKRDNECQIKELELESDSYAKYFKLGRTPVDLKLEKLDFEIKALQTILNENRQKHEAVTSQLNKQILAGSNKSVRDQIVGAIDLTKISPKDLNKLLLTKLGHKQYFDIIRRSNMKPLYGQLVVSQSQVTNVRKQIRHLKREYRKWEEHLSRSSTLDGTDWDKFDQTDLDILIQRIYLEPQNFLRALRIANKELEGIEDNPAINQIFDLPQWSLLDFNLFIRIAALSERVTGLESVIGSLKNKTNLNALLIKLKKAKELFCLTGGCNSCECNMTNFLFGPDHVFVPDKKQPFPIFSTHKTKLLTVAPKTALSEIRAEDLKLEFLAANMSPMIVDKLAMFLVAANSTMDFIKFLEYLPLFVQINQRIVSNPLNSSCLPVIKSYANRFSYLDKKY